MKKVKKIAVVSNTHWDREFRNSFEKTRYNLLRMMDTTIEILENDPDFHSFTMDGHTIMIDDYLEMRPENAQRVKKLISEGRLVIGPYYTLAEQFSISHEALVRNLMLGRKKTEMYGGRPNTVGYTPSSWGQTGQYPQILHDFGIKQIMFYRGISHHEAPAEYLWSAPDGTTLVASRFALFCRYNWYYQVHRSVTRGKVWDKDYVWGKYHEVPVIKATDVPEGTSYDVASPTAEVDGQNIHKAIEDMLTCEDGHFTTPVFLAMNGHDISVAFPLESNIIKAAKAKFENEIEIEHTDLEGFWKDVEKYLDKSAMKVLKGERRSYLKEGKWTYLFPGTISARTYLKQSDFQASNLLSYWAEPMATMTLQLFSEYPELYLQRAWQYLLSNHTHDANGGCGPDAVCLDMQYRYRKTKDISEIIINQSTTDVVKNLCGDELNDDAVLLTVFNSLPFERNETVKITVNMPKSAGTGLSCENLDIQLVSSEETSVFVDNIWDVPTILDCMRHEAYISLKNIPAMGYKTFKLSGESKITEHQGNLLGNGNTLENDLIKIDVNSNGTINALNKKTGKHYYELNYLTSQGETGNAWKHVSPQNDMVFNSKASTANINLIENGELSATIQAEFSFAVPESCEIIQSENKVEIPVVVTYTLTKNSDTVIVKMDIDNKAQDHWLRVNFPTDIKTSFSVADSHYDIVKRDVEIPDSTGWVESAFGMHPLRTFAALTDSNNGFAVMPKGLFEYEVLNNSILALTILRSCRIKLAVSEEKTQMLDDEGIQCPGKNTYEYAICLFEDDYEILPNKAVKYFAPVTCVVSGKGKGSLPLENSIINIDNPKIHVTAIKKAEKSSDIIIRLFNGTQETQPLNISFGFKAESIIKCSLNEEEIEEISSSFEVGAKKIMTIKVVNK